MKPRILQKRRARIIAYDIKTPQPKESTQAYLVKKDLLDSRLTRLMKEDTIVGAHGGNHNNAVSELLYNRP